MSKIYYLIPDLYRPQFTLKSFIGSIINKQPLLYLSKNLFPKHKAVGGVKVMYQHCIMLRELGFDATPVLMGNYKGNYFGYDLKFMTLKEMKKVITSEDIVVSTEYEPYDGLKFPKATKILFMQNWVNITRRLKQNDFHKNYYELGYDYVITCGDYCSFMVEQKMNIKATTITNGIDQSKFSNIPEKREPGRVLVLSRKNFSDFQKIKNLCGYGVNFQVVDGLTQAELIEEYQKADIFLATGYPEGLPLPPLEAMNCGCVVVGFTGGGAKEYMLDGETAMVADDGDCETAAKKLLLILDNPELKEKLRDNGYKLAKTYTLDNTSNLLKDFFTRISKVSE